MFGLWLLGGAAISLGWQSGLALLPDKNSRVKFTCVSTLYPLAIAIFRAS